MSGFRTCWNYKSRGHPDVPCTRETLFGDFCSYHTKTPHRFSTSNHVKRLSKKKKDCLRRFVRLCRTRIGLLSARRQGPVAPFTNQTELITLEPVETIYPPYRFSFCEKGLFWCFDIRALLRGRKEGTPLCNPYTLSVLSEGTLDKIQAHVQWLNRRRYRLEYMLNESSTCQQRITELCLLLDSHGYWTNVDWFCSMTVPLVHEFANRLDSLWIEELGLTDTQRQTIYPLWTPDRTYLVPLLRGRHRGPLLDQFLTFLFIFLRAAPERESRTLACVYVLKALASINSRVQHSYPWLL